jgi:hypothetical protein
MSDNECPVCFEEKECEDLLQSMCRHHICKDCYEGLLKKKCPLCRGAYENLDEYWYKECVEAKSYVLQNTEGSLSWKYWKSLDEEDTVEREDDYEVWKEDVIREGVDEYVDGIDKETLGVFLTSYGFGDALKDYVDEYGFDGLPMAKNSLRVEKCLVFHKIHTFLREFL